MSDVRPTILGYQSVRLDSLSSANETRIQMLQDFAEREGYSLGSVYTDLNGDGRGLERLLTAVRSGDSLAVAVAQESDLGHTLRFRRYVRGAVEEAGARLLVASDEDPLDSSVPAVSPC